MSIRSERGSGSKQSRRPLVATAAVIGGAGMVLGAPAAALIAAPVAQAAPVFAVPQQLPPIPPFPPIGGGGISAAFLDPVYDIFGLIPGLNIFVSNGIDGTAASPNGGNAGLLAGNGGNGFSRIVAGHRCWR